MTLQFMGLEQAASDQGCIFPILDDDGKRRRLCGEPTIILDQSGNKRAFCAKHAQIVAEKVRQMKLESKRGDNKGRQKKMILKGGLLHSNVI